MDQDMANIIMTIHFAYVIFVISGFVLIPLGAWRRWRWTQFLRYRLLHTLAITYVAGEQVLGVTCPLTQWEYALRGHHGAGRAFMPDLVHAIMFYSWPRYLFTALYIFLTLLVLSYWWFFPPQSKRSLYRNY